MRQATLSSTEKIADLEKRIEQLEAALRQIANMVPNAGKLESQPVGIARIALEDKARR